MRFSAPGILVLALGLFAPAIARAADAASENTDGRAEPAWHHCKKVDAPIITKVYTEGCASPLCTRGTVGAGPLEGSTEFSLLTGGPGPKPGTMIYTGVLTITTRHGSVTIHDTGILDNTTVPPTFFELDPIVAGTGKFRNASGWLTSQGFATGTGFIGTLTGAVCKAGQDERGQDEQANDQDEKDEEEDSQE